MNLNVRSEINPLRLVITHRPGVEHLNIVPENLVEKIVSNNKIIDNPDYLLFDDLIYVPDAIKEHNSLYEILHNFTDGNCYEFTDLLNVVLNNEKIKEKLIDECILLEEKLYSIKIDKKLLTNLHNEALIDTILTGENNNIKIFKNPIPNLMFTRDIAVCIGETILITWSKKHVRKRENILSKYIFKYHKMFKSLKLYDFHRYHKNLTIEGGDILVFNKDIVCIGVSERTPLRSIEVLAPLFYKEGFKKIFAIDLPKKRALMHLDTIFTRINEEEVLIFPPVLEKNFDNHSIKTFIFDKNNTDTIETNENLINLLKNEGLNIKFIKCGSDSKIMQKREQWTDGANAFALSPGKIIGYDCNKFTLKELKKANYTIISSQKYIKNYRIYNNSNEKIVITIKGSELLRGRGGPRCLTLPIFRI